MGQPLMKLAPGSDESKEKEIGSIIEKCYDKYFKDLKNDSIANFHRAICQTVEEINEKLNSTQIRIPDEETLKKVYKEHFSDTGKKTLEKEEFRKILPKLIMDMRLTGFRSKDIFLYVFGVPAAATLAKRQLPLKAIRDDIFVPGVTSATVFVLAMLRKI